MSCQGYRFYKITNWDITNGAKRRFEMREFTMIELKSGEYIDIDDIPERIEEMQVLLNAQDKKINELKTSSFDIVSGTVCDWWLHNTQVEADGRCHHCQGTTIITREQN